MRVMHTPGPWRHQQPRGYQRAIDRKFEIVAPLNRGEQVIVGEHTGIDCLTEANARLIAAAPELREALAALFEHCAMVHKHWGDGSNAEQANAAIERGRALLARIDGRTDMRALPVRRCSIECLQHPEWGTFGVMEDRGSYYEIHGRSGSRVLDKAEAVTHWRVAGEGDLTNG